MKKEVSPVQIIAALGAVIVIILAIVFWPKPTAKTPKDLGIGLPAKSGGGTIENNPNDPLVNGGVNPDH